jgi:hypothetical protein
VKKVTDTVCALKLGVRQVDGQFDGA